MSYDVTRDRNRRSAREWSNEHRCAIPGCGKMIARKFLMCGHHWACVPKALQDDVYNPWRAFNSRHGSLEAYVLARGQAIRSVTSGGQS